MNESCHFVEEFAVHIKSDSMLVNDSEYWTLCLY